MRIEVIGETNEKHFETLVSGVREFNRENLGEELSVPLSALAYDAENEIIGGVAGRTIYKQFFIEVVWVSPAARQTGLGSKLMKCAEQEARNRGCVAAQVDTLSFQAPDFYKKLGFEMVGHVSGIPESPDRFFLLKRYH